MFTILVIDSDRAYSEKVKKDLAALPVSVNLASTGSLGLNMAEALRPDVVILCVELSDMSGFRVFKDLRDKYATSNAAVVIISAKAKESDFEKHRRLPRHAEAYLHKPVPPNNLVDCVASLLRLEVGKTQYPELLETSELENLLEVSEPEWGESFQVSSYTNFSNSQFLEEINKQNSELEHLRAEVAAFKPMLASLKELERETAKLRQAVADRDRKIVDLETPDLSVLDDENEAALLEARKVESRLRGELEALRAEYQGTHEQLEQERSQARERQSRIETLQNDLIERNTLLKVLKSELGNRDFELEELRLKQEASRATQEKLAKEREEQAREYELARVERAEEQALLERAREELLLANSKNAELQAASAREAARIADFETGRYEMEKELRHHREQAERETQKARQLDRSLQESEQIRRELVESAGELEARLTLAEREREQLEADLRAADHKWGERFELVQSEIRQRREEQTRMETELGKIAGENEHLRVERDDLRRKNQLMHEESSSEIQNLVAQLEKTSAELNRANQVNREQSTELDSRRLECRELGARTKLQEERLATVGAALEEVTERSENLRSDLEGGRRKIAELEQQIQLKEREHLAQKSELNKRFNEMALALEQARLEQRQQREELEARLEREKDGHDERMAQSRANAEKLEEALRESCDQLDQAGRDLKAAEEMHLRLLERKAAEHLAELRGMEGDWSDERARLREEVAVQSELLAKAHADLLAKDADFQQERELLEHRLEELREDLEKQRIESVNRMSEMGQDIQDRDKANAAQRRKLEIVEAELGSAQRMLSEEQERHERTREHAAREAEEADENFRAQIDQGKSRIEELEKELARLETLEERHEVLLSECDRLRLSNEMLHSRMGKTKRILEAGLREIAGTSDELAFEED